MTVFSKRGDDMVKRAIDEFAMGIILGVLTGILGNLWVHIGWFYIRQAFNLLLGCWENGGEKIHTNNNWRSIVRQFFRVLSRR